MYDFVNIVGQITQYMDKPAVEDLYALKVQAL